MVQIQRKDYAILAECVDVRVFPKGKDKYGMLEGGYLVLKVSFRRPRLIEPDLVPSCDRLDVCLFGGLLQDMLISC